MRAQVKPARSYRSEVRAEQARRTRDRIITAARDRFVENGYAGTSIGSIAEAARVVPETVYNIFGTKRALLEEIVRVTIAGGFDEPDDLLERTWVAELQAQPTVTARIGGFADHTARTLERMAPIHALVWLAAAGDAALADLPSQIHQARFRRQRQVLEALTAGATGIQRNDAADTFSALASPELHHVLRRVRGWSARRYSNWLRATVLAATGSGPAPQRP